jgi:hypothetical protein
MSAVTRRCHPGRNVAKVMAPMKTSDVCVRTLSVGQTGVGSAENRVVHPNSTSASLSQEARLPSKPESELILTRREIYVRKEVDMAM